MKTRTYLAALYMRLSRDDGAGESASIGTQRKMLRAFARENKFDVFDEYADDGWSGTTFDRPAWNRLIRDIEAKKINLVITKDLSRLGRDYIAAGQYTEIFFPSRGVRYIAVNDGYDSDSPFSDIVPFKNVLNEMYARDTSRKIRSAFRTKMEEGAFIGNFAPFGYRKDPQNKNHLLLDPGAAPVVRELFRRAADGAAPAEIAGILNERGILTPSRYRSTLRDPNAGGVSGCGKWTSSMVCKLLKNVVYLGHVAQGKTTKLSFKSSLILHNPQEAWIVAEHMHEPLVSQEVFDRVRKRCVARRQPPKTDFINLFSGIAVCADCGRNMSSAGRAGKSGSRRLVCGGYKLKGISACSNHAIDYRVLCDIVIRELRTIQRDQEQKELTPALLHRLIDRIEIGQGTSAVDSGRKHQAIRIHYKFRKPEQDQQPPTA